LVSSDTALSELVEVSEKLFNSDSLHDDGGADAVLNVGWVVGDINTLVHETVGNDIHILGRLPEESALLSGSDSEGVHGLRLGSLGSVAGEHVLWTIDILAEQEVVNLVGVASVAVLADHEVKHFLRGRHQSEVFEHTQELLGGDVKRF